MARIRHRRRSASYSTDVLSLRGWQEHIPGAFSGEGGGLAGHAVDVRLVINLRPLRRLVSQFHQQCSPADETNSHVISLRSLKRLPSKPQKNLELRVYSSVDCQRSTPIWEKHVRTFLITLTALGVVAIALLAVRKCAGSNSGCTRDGDHDRGFIVGGHAAITRMAGSQ